MKNSITLIATLFFAFLSLNPVFSQEPVQIGYDIGGEAADDKSGISLSLSSDGSRLAIGTFGNNGNGTWAGHVRVYGWSGESWAQVGGDIDGEAVGDESGFSVSLSSDGSRVAIGAPLNNGNGTWAGHVRIYDWDGESWTQIGADIDGEAADDQLGFSVSLSSDGSRVAIGARINNETGTNAGHVRVYDWDGENWAQVGADIDGEAEFNESGSSVSLSSDGNRVAIGAPRNNGNGILSGHVRVYDWDGGSWTQVGADIDGEAEYDLSGNVSLSSDGNRVAIGAGGGNDATGTNTGHVRVYDWDGGDWAQVGADIDGEAENNLFGRSVSLSSDGNRIAIGAPNNDGNGENAGHVRVYELKPVSITSKILVGEVMVSPNPTTSLLHIQLPDAIRAPFNATIYDNRGAVLKQQHISAGQPIPVGELPNGFYILKLTDGERAYVGKFIKG
jgi:hypothetical protein